MRPLVRVFALSFAALAACSIPPETPTDDGRTLRVEHGTSFGMCLGYCTTTLHVDADSTVLTLTPGGRGDTSIPERRFAIATPPDRWAQIAAHAGSTAVDALPETIGCPDCADGGAEWIEVMDAGGTARVTYEHGAAVEPVAALQEALRALRAHFDDDVEAARAAIAPGE